MYSTRNATENEKWEPRNAFLRLQFPSHIEKHFCKPKMQFKAGLGGLMIFLKTLNECKVHNTYTDVSAGSGQE